MTCADITNVAMHRQIFMHLIYILIFLFRVILTLSLFHHEFWNMHGTPCTGHQSITGQTHIHTYREIDIEGKNLQELKNMHTLQKASWFKPKTSFCRVTALSTKLSYENVCMYIGMCELYLFIYVQYCQSK